VILRLSSVFNERNVRQFKFVQLAPLLGSIITSKIGICDYCESPGAAGDSGLRYPSCRS